jgi:non-specific serine/threonine protein kinase
MRAAAEWSYDLLNESEKLVFRRLSVFAGQFTPDAAETVASVNTSIVSHQSAAGGGAAAPQSVEFFDRFASLADKSLLIRRRHAGDETNFGMLRIVREYAQSVLETDDDANEIRLRHAKLYLSLAEEAEPHLRAHDSCLWMSRLNEEHENLRAALHWSIKEEPQIAARLAAAIRHFWLTRGYLREGMGWAQEILDKECDMTPETRWKLLTICGNISQFQGDIQKAHKFYEEGLAAARRSGDQKYIAQSLRGLGALAYIKYDLPTARKLIDEALAISRSEGDNFGLAASLGRLGDISNVQGDRCTAKDLTSEALAIFRRLGYAEGVSAKLYNLGAIVFLEGDHEMAQSCFEEAHLTSLELREKINTRLIFDGFAAIAAEKGDYSLAARLSGAAQSIDTTIGYAIEPAEQIFRDSYLGKLRAAMTEEEFEAESAIGRKLTMEQMRKLVQPGPRVESNIKGSNSGSGVPLHTTSSVSTPMNDVESLSGVFARAARYQNVVLAVLLSILLVTAAFIFALWIWGAK